MSEGNRRGLLTLFAVGVMALALGVAACGGGGGGESTAPGTIPKLSNKPIKLRFLWFEWPPAHALEDFINKEYKKVRPNVTAEVKTVPIAQWHDAIFTQFAARKTSFDMPVLDSQYIGEAVTNGNILDLTDFVKKNIDTKAYDPYLLAAYGQYPQAQTGQLDPKAHLYGLPLLGDTWAMVYRKDLIGDQPPATWDEMLAKAKKCQDDHPGMSGLGFHQQGSGDAAAITFNAVDGVYGGQIWDQKDKKIEGVFNSPAGHKAIHVLVDRMVPLAPKGSGNWFIDEVNAAINQGKVCIAFQWVAALGAVLDPKSSTLGKTKSQILDKLGFATLPHEDANPVPLGGMGLHVSKYAPKDHQAEALNFIKWFEQPATQKKWAAAGGVPSRKDALSSPQFLNAAPWNKVYADSVPRLRDFWNLPTYAKLLNVQSTEINAALTGSMNPDKAVDDIAKKQQAILDGGEQ
jgi:multiple sugar transport system substrate-binding protein